MGERVRIAILITLTVGASAAGTAGGTPAVPGISAPLLPEIVVIGSTPIPGAAIDIDKFPGNVQVLSSADLSRQGTPSLTQALNTNLSSVTINDDLDDPFQPDILYRGFEASPVLGTPQGLAVYQNGVRINEAFGDTVNWDLLPDIAIDRVELVSASPLYGLNALGGAIAVTMKNGFTYPGGDLELSGGSYGNRAILAQWGASSDAFGFYVAGKALSSDGWREFSNDKIRTLYAVGSWRLDGSALDLSYAHADNTVMGQGAAPVQELAVDRSLVFTGPQKNLNTLNFFTLNATAKLADHWSLQGVAYYRDYGQSVANGNTTHYAACDSLPGSLCQPDRLTPLTNAAGETLPDISVGGTIPIGENDFEQIHAWGRGIAMQVSDSQAILGHVNQLSIGAALDYASTSFYTGAQVGVINPQLLVLPSDLIVDTPEDSDGAIANGDPVPVSVDAVNKNVGIYLTDTFDVTSALNVTLSGRYNVTHIDLVDQLGTNLSGSSRFVHLNPAIGATYRVLPTATVYAGFSTNTRPPTASEIECSDPLTPCLLPTNLAGDPPNLRQVVAHAIELGVRGTMPGSIAGSQWSWVLGAFRTQLHDDIYGVATSVSQGYFQNIGDTRRQGIELGLNYHAERLAAFLQFSLVEATFQSALVVPSPSNPHQDDDGDISVEPGDHLPGIPEHRLKLGGSYRFLGTWTVGATVNVTSSAHLVGDEANLLAPLPGYGVVDLFSTYRLLPHLEIFASIDNLFNRKYATWGILSDPTGVAAPGIPPDAQSNDPRVDNRFESPAAPFEAFGGIRLRL